MTKKGYWIDGYADIEKPDAHAGARPDIQVEMHTAQNCIDADVEQKSSDANVGSLAPAQQNETPANAGEFLASP